MAFATRLKSMLPGKSIADRMVLFGLFKGLRMQLDLRSQTQVYLGLWERETYGFIKRAARVSQWAVDVGAGRGELVLYLLGCPRMQRVIAVEPLRIASDIMKANLALNGFDHDRRLTISGDFLSLSREPGHTTLDAFELDHERAGFIKIDVDGGELDVLKSGVALLTRGRVSLLVETHSLELEQSCVKLLGDWGYHCEIIDYSWWRRFVPESRPTAHNRWFSAVKRN